MYKKLLVGWYVESSAKVDWNKVIVVSLYQMHAS